jgi:hypothetical protein
VLCRREVIVLWPVRTRTGTSRHPMTSVAPATQIFILDLHLLPFLTLGSSTASPKLIERFVNHVWILPGGCNAVLASIFISATAAHHSERTRLAKAPASGKVN